MVHIHMGFIIISIINKILNLKKFLIFRSSGKKKAIISYVLFPKFMQNIYFSKSHNNKLMCKLMVDVLLSKEYQIILYDYNSEPLSL